MKNNYYDKRRANSSCGYRSFGAAKIEEERRYKRKQKTLNTMIFCLSIALVIMSMKAMNIKAVNVGLKKVSAFLSSDTFSFVCNTSLLIFSIFLIASIIFSFIKNHAHFLKI